MGWWRVTATLVGALMTAGVLGATHAIEPDHVAGISALTSRYGDARMSALAGACFSLGHVVLVVGWLLVGYVVFGKTAFAPVYDTVGTIGIGVMLGLLGATMTLAGLRTVAYAHGHEHEHNGKVHSHTHVHLPFLSDNHSHGATHNQGYPARKYFKTGIVGALFALSPPISMIIFGATLFPILGPWVVGGAVATYSVVITVAMSAIGAGVGAVFSYTQAISLRTYGMIRATAGILVIASAVVFLEGTVPI